MKKILFYISSLSKGGAERVLTNLADFLKDQNYKVVIVTNIRAKGEYEISSVILRRVIEEETTTGSGRFQTIRRRIQTLRTIYKEEAPDLVISFMGKANLTAMLATAFTKIPVILSVRAEPALEYPTFFTRKLANLLFARSAGVICQTEDAKRFFSEKVQKKTVILPNSIKGSFIRPSFTGIRKEEIVTVGRLDENKNHAMLIRAFANIHKEFPKIILKIIGNGEDYHKLEALISSMKLEKNVFLMGEQEQIENLLYEAKVFVLCSNSEGMPNSLMEAMALGVPSISTDCPCGGPGMLIEDGKNGYLIPVGGEEELKDKLCKILKHPQIAEELGQEANKIGKQYSPEKVNYMWQAYIDKKCEKKF